VRGLIICSALAFTCCLPAFAAPRARDAGSYLIHWRVDYGVASWYGEAWQGRLMASGKPYNEYDMVAAHRTLPLGTEVSVTNLRNGRSVIVRIMDRGPHVAGRAIDLSKAAAERLRFTHQGLAPVKIRVLRTPKEQTSNTDVAHHSTYNHETAVSSE
jgi:rare lipoprotein A